jgi:hypothetical protein
MYLFRKLLCKRHLGQVTASNWFATVFSVSTGFAQSLFENPLDSFETALADYRGPKQCGSSRRRISLEPTFASSDWII